MMMMMMQRHVHLHAGGCEEVAAPSMQASTRAAEALGPFM
jgi:hypothetical protein